eukprot:gene5740-5674_t
MTVNSTENMTLRVFMAMCAVADLVTGPPTAAYRSQGMSTSPTGHSFTIENDRFMQDGKPVLLKSGSFHYSRAPAALWRDRLTRMKAMGLNAVQTYVPWNWHEEIPGTVDFSGDRNITAFVLTAQDIGLLRSLHVRRCILPSPATLCFFNHPPTPPLRPSSPAEWEFGGFPAWLINQPGVALRTYSDGYIKYVDLFWKQQLLPVLKPLLFSNGGPIVMVQPPPLLPTSLLPPAADLFHA